VFESFLNGILLGFGVSVPFGPVNILILSYALSSFKNAFCIGLGALFADVIYLSLLQFGLLNFLNNPLFYKILALFGFCFLSYMAFTLIKTKVNKLNFEVQTIQNPFKSFLKGMLLNLSNPYVIGFWLSVAGVSSTYSSPFLLCFGLILSIFIWIFSLSFFVRNFSHFFGVKTLSFINIFSALIVEYFALSLIYKNFF